MDPEPPSFFFIFLISANQLISIVFLVVLLLFSALISGAEVAFFSLNPTDFDDESNNKEDAEPNKNSSKIARIQKLLAKPKKLLATILVANNAINIAIVLLFASLSDLFFASITSHFYGINLRFIIEVGVVTFLILLFGEILPKIYANRNKFTFASFMAYPISILDTVLAPISVPMQKSIVYIEEKFGKKTQGISVGQLSQALELTSDEDTTHEEQKILKGIVTFGNTDTKQVMKPRMDIFALNEDVSYQKIMPQIIENGYSRIPVYKDTIDNITGILVVKDLMPYIDQQNFDWAKLKREPYFVPENKKLDDLLNEFKQMKMHQAIVVDEYGGTSGLITLEDIIEEIVGEISDEFDDEDIVYSRIDNHNYIFDGKTSLKDFYNVLQITNSNSFEETRGEAETLAGFLLEISKGFPRKGEIIKFENYKFKIEAFENKRIKQIKVSINK